MWYFAVLGLVQFLDVFLLENTALNVLPLLTF